MRRIVSFLKEGLWLLRTIVLSTVIAMPSIAHADTIPQKLPEFNFQPTSIDFMPSIIVSPGLSPNNKAVPDSVLQHIFQFASAYSEQVKSYEAQLYLKGRMSIHNRNRIIRYVPSMFRFEKGVNEYIHESVSELHYTAPDIYDRKIMAVSTTLSRQNSRFFDVLDYLKFNIYSPVTMDNRIVSPFSESTSRHYVYELDSELFLKGEKCLLISVKPRFNSTQLIEGKFIISTADWHVRYMDFKGRYEVVDFTVNMKMGDSPQTRGLPEYINMNLVFSFMKNKMEMDYVGWLTYDNVKFHTGENLLMRDMITKRKYKKRRYNLSNSYTLTSDTTRIYNDLQAFKKIRPIPLTPQEDSIYADYERRLKERNDTTVAVSDSIVKKRKANVFWGQLGDALISSYRIDMSNVGSIKCSPLINPVMLDYSRRKGFRYRQVFKYNKIFPDGRHLRIAPQIGFNFTKKELYAKLYTKFEYDPIRHGAIEVETGNGNRTYSNVIKDKITPQADSIFSAQGLDIDYFKDIYLNVFHTIDITNGLSLKAGVSMHWRYTKETPDLKAVAQTRYNSFSPRLRVEWTPGMYYYINGGRKIDVGSHYPTFVLDMEKGIPVLNSSASYLRMELSAEQTINIRGVHTLAYHVGGGFFAETDELYFMDYVDFADRNLPQGWTDDIGGTFQQLSSRWYNSADNYVRANVTFETPFILLYPFTKALSFIQKERLYGGIVFMPHLNPYIELGYGIGTHIFDIGVFTGFKNGAFYTAGVKFEFKLFDD